MSWSIYAHRATPNEATLIVDACNAPQGIKNYHYDAINGAVAANNGDEDFLIDIKSFGQVGEHRAAHATINVSVSP